MHLVVVENVSVTVAIDLKNELLGAGLVLNEDFQWAYMHPITDSYAYTQVTPSRVEFEFKDPAMATFYSLRWL